MQIGRIIKDALEYPLLDLKKIFILGILIVLSDTSGFSMGFGNENPVLLFIFGIIGVLISIFVIGYLYKIIETHETRSPPPFTGQTVIFRNGLKTLVVILVYLIPVMLVLIMLAFNDYNAVFGMTYGGISSSIPSMTGILLGTIVWPGILNLIGLLNNGALVAGIYILGAIFYLIIIIPLTFKAIVKMSRTGKISSAFNIKEILRSLLQIGVLKLVLWYFATGIIFLVVLVAGIMATNIFSIFIHPEIGAVLLSLIVIPYLYIFLARSVTLAFRRLNHFYGAYIF